MADSTTAIGDKYEDTVKAELEEWGLEVVKKKGSGSVHGNGDMVVDKYNIQIGCKYKDTKSIGGSDKELTKAIKQAGKYGRLGVVATTYSDERGKQRTAVVTDIDVFMQIIGSQLKRLC